MTNHSEIDALRHDHIFLGAGHDENSRRTMWVVVLTALMMVSEIVAGALFNSMALLADGFHMATHAGALGVAVAAYAYAKKHARSSRFTFGTGKVGDLAGFASALVLGLVHALSKPTPISWLSLHTQFGAGFKLLRQFKPTFIEALAMALAVYPEASISTDSDGLTLFPSPPAILKAEARRLGLT